MPYAALFGPDPVPDRTHLFFVAMHQQIEGALRTYSRAPILTSVLSSSGKQYLCK